MVVLFRNNSIKTNRQDTSFLSVFCEFSRLLSFLVFYVVSERRSPVLEVKCECGRVFRCRKKGLGNRTYWVVTSLFRSEVIFHSLSPFRLFSSTVTGGGSGVWRYEFRPGWTPLTFEIGPIFKFLNYIRENLLWREYRLLIIFTILWTDFKTDHYPSRPGTVIQTSPSSSFSFNEGRVRDLPQVE